MKLSYKIILISLTSSAFIVLFVFAIYTQRKQVFKDTALVISSRETLNASAALQKLIVDMETGFRGYLITGQPEYLEPYNIALSQYTNAYNNLIKLVGTAPEDLEILDSIQVHASSWKKMVGTLVQKKLAGQSTKIENGKIRIDEIRVLFDKLDKRQASKLDTELYKLNQSQKFVSQLLLWLTIGLLLFLAFFTYFIVRNISQKVSSLLYASQALASGNFETKIPVTDRDEFGVLSGTINETANRLKHVFEEKNKAEERAVASEQLFRLLVEKASDIIFLISHTGSFTYVNPMAVEVTGYTEEELSNIPYYKLIDGPQQERVRLFFLNQLQTNEQYSYQEFEILTKTGQKIWIGQNAQLILKDGIKGFLAVARDISGSKKVEEELILARKNAEESVKAKEAFLTSISHEFRTPLNAIIGFTELILRSNTNAAHQEYINAINLSGHNLLTLVNRVLNFSNKDAEAIEVLKIDFNLEKLLANVVKNHAQESLKKGLPIRLFMEDDLPILLNGDAVKLQQIIENLLQNAIKYTHNGKIEIKVNTIEKRKDEVALEFQIIDTGIGIPAQEIKNIFEIFYRGSDEDLRHTSGAGLGLSITKNLVEMLGGKITVASKVEVGTTFTFILTFLLTEPSDTKQENASLNYCNTSSIIRTLVFEDNVLNQVLVKNVLADFNIIADIAENGKIGIEMLEKENYDIVLMDLRMPIMDGFEATQYIRTKMEKPKSQIPIIAITANVLSKEQEKCKEVGMDDFISKPFVTEVLLEKTRRLVKLHPMPISDLKIDKQTPSSNSSADLTYLNALCGGNREFMKNMITTFFVENEKYIAQLEYTARREAWGDLRDVAHKMKSAIAIIGIHKLEEPVASMEKYAMNRTQLDEIPNLISIVKKISLQTVEELELELTKLANEI